MDAETPTTLIETRTRPGRGFKVWHFTILVAFSAIAIADIQDHRVSDPILIGLAAGGFAVYALIAWLVWIYAWRFEPRLGRVKLLGFYLAGMAAFFFLATVTYLLIEYVYLGGRF